MDIPNLRPNPDLGISGPSTAQKQRRLLDSTTARYLPLAQTLSFLTSVISDTRDATFSLLEGIPNHPFPLNLQFLIPVRIY